MKIFGRWHLVQIPNRPMHSLRSEFFISNPELAPEKHNISVATTINEVAKKVYKRALNDMGIKDEHLPKGSRS